MKRFEFASFAFVIAVALVLIAAWRCAVALDGVDRASHDLVVGELKAQADKQASAFSIERAELGAAIAALAATCLVLYRNARADARKNREVITRLTTAIEGLPCKPDLVCQEKEGDADVVISG